MKFNLHFVIASLLLLSMLVQPVYAAPKDKVIELTLSDFYSPQESGAIAARSWIKEIEKRTDGRVKIVHFPSNSLVSAAKMYSGVVQGITDIGMSCCGYTRGVFPVFEIFDVITQGIPNGWVASKVAWDFYKEFKAPGWDPVHVLYIHAMSPGALFCTKPARKLEDLKGLQIRVAASSVERCKSLGATPISMPQPEVYEAARKGLVEGSLTPVSVLEALRQAEVFKYTTLSKALSYSTAFYAIMNKKKWESLPDDIKKIFTEVSEEWVGVNGEEWVKSDYKAYEYALSKGNEFIRLSKEEDARWVNAIQSMIDKYVAEKEAAGIPAKKIEEFFIERTNYWSEHQPKTLQTFER